MQIVNAEEPKNLKEKERGVKHVKIHTSVGECPQATQYVSHSASDIPKRHSIPRFENFFPFLCVVAYPSPTSGTVKM